MLISIYLSSSEITQGKSSLSPDDGRVLKVVSVPKEWETEEIILEELNVFKVISNLSFFSKFLLFILPSVGLMTYDPGLLLVAVFMSSTSQTKITPKEENQICHGCLLS